MENNIEYDINIYGNLMIIDNEKQNIKVVEVPSIKKLFNERQQLISFLEDKIKKCNKEIEDFLDREYYCIALDKKEAFQEVLDFINKGGKDE